MDLDFAELELLAQRTLHPTQMPETLLDESAKAILTQAAFQYKSAPLTEVFDLLENALESYAVTPTLAENLQESARREIEFFFSLLQEKLDLLLQQTSSERMRREMQLL
ncbi:MAG: hypothetical protein KME15_06395 [Drouetiella hepatica Uher 2000/2452]|jgi:hypothetical protein|uniref:Uncharacterized protein n=1 Tax=Drouetiella hepatica Uher 2000/2452 TaxID=904376 RepID=A0A951Q9B7_9CYAN|nr:hypothetical protein [Drouetiella hepatica Uher 2000/2452]